MSKTAENMNLSISNFLRKVLDEHATSRPASDRPLIALDECSNHPLIHERMLQLVRRGQADGVLELWFNFRRIEDGTVCNFGGNSARFLRDQMDVGSAVKHISSSDSDIVYHLIAHFTNNDRLFILSENTRLNDLGLRRLLREEIAPVLANYHDDRFTIGALFRRGKTPLVDYLNQVESMILSTNYPQGYKEWLI